MKRILFFLLLSALLLSACARTPALEPVPGAAAPYAPEPPAPPSSQAPVPEVETPPEPIEGFSLQELQQAVVQTALAYYYHDPYVQYEGASLVKDLYGTRALDSQYTAEYAAADEYLYTWCSDYGYRVYREVTGWTYTRSSAGFLTKDVVKIPADDPLTVFYYNPGTDARSSEQALEQCRSVLQPGDLLTYMTSDVDGHLLIYLGDAFGDGKEYFLHSTSATGGTIRWDGDMAGFSPFEAGGSVKLNTADEILFVRGGSRYLGNALVFNVIRPSNVLADENGRYFLTPAAQSRLRYTGLECWKEADRPQYHDVLNGEDLQIFLTLTNHSDTDYAGLRVTEPIPEGQSVLDISDGGQTGNGSIVWTLDLPAGQSIRLHYTVPVCADAGAVLTFASGLVGEIPTRSFQMQVAASRLTDAQNSSLLELADGALPAFLTDAGTVCDLELVNTFYREILGIESGLPASFADLLSALTEQKSALGSSTRYMQLKEPQQLDAAGAQLWKMLLQKHFSGRYANSGTEEIHTRNIEFVEERYQPGDIFIGTADSRISTLIPSNLVIQIYLGSGRVLVLRPGSAEVDSFERTVACDLAMDFVFALRPTLAVNSSQPHPSGFDGELLYVHTGGETLVFERYAPGIDSLTQQTLLDTFDTETELEGIVWEVYSAEEYPDLTYVLVISGTNAFWTYRRI